MEPVLDALCFSCLGVLCALALPTLNMASSVNPANLRTFLRDPVSSMWPTVGPQSLAHSWHLCVVLEGRKYLWVFVAPVRDFPRHCLTPLKHPGHESPGRGSSSALLSGPCSEARGLTHQAKNKTQKSSLELVMFGQSLTCIEKVACDSQSECLFMSLVIFEKFCPRHSVLSEICPFTF